MSRSKPTSEEDDGVECLYAGVCTGVKRMMWLIAYVQEYAP